MMLSSEINPEEDMSASLRFWFSGGSIVARLCNCHVFKYVGDGKCVALHWGEKRPGADPSCAVDATSTRDDVPRIRVQS